MKEKMNKIEEIRLRSCVCEHVTEWAGYFNVSEDEIWDALRDFAEYRVSLRVSEIANAIISNGETYELVANDTGKGLCESCDLRERCDNIAGYVYICEAIHGEGNKHYKKHRGGKANDEMADKTD